MDAVLERLRMNGACDGPWCPGIPTYILADLLMALSQWWKWWACWNCLNLVGFNGERKMLAKTIPAGFSIYTSVVLVPEKIDCTFGAPIIFLDLTYCPGTKMRHLTILQDRVLFILL